MKVLNCAAAACMLLAGSALTLAQSADGGGGRRGRGPHGMRGGPPSIERVVERLANRLELTDEQREELDLIVESYRMDFEAHRAMREQAQELRRQIRDARDSGDDALVEELRDKMHDLRQIVDNPMRAMMD